MQSIFRKYHITFLCFTLFVVLPAIVWGQEIKISMKAVGQIKLLDKKVRIGTAFVAGETHNIFIPAHVAIRDTLLFAPYNSGFSYRIVRKYILPEYDLAIYKRTGGEQPDSYPIGKMDRMLPGDQIIYLGWENDSTLQINKSEITSKGQTIHKTEVVNFIDFFGHGIPGYSGGPVFNSQSEVIAMIVQGWDVTPINSDKPIRNMRAYSIDLLRILELKLEETRQADTLNQMGKLRLMDAIEK